MITWYQLLLHIQFKPISSEVINLLYSFHTTRAAYKTMPLTNSNVARVFLAPVTLLPIRCLATIEGYTYRLEGLMKHASEMGSCAMIHIPNLIKIGSGIATHFNLVSFLAYSSTMKT